MKKKSNVTYLNESKAAMLAGLQTLMEAIETEQITDVAVASVGPEKEALLLYPNNHPNALLGAIETVKFYLLSAKIEYASEVEFESEMELDEDDKEDKDD